MEQSGLEPVSIRDARAANSSLSYYTTVPVQVFKVVLYPKTKTKKKRNFQLVFFLGTLNIKKPRRCWYAFDTIFSWLVVCDYVI